MSDDALDSAPDDEAEREAVRAWRLMQAMVLGYEWTDAERIADSSIDIHDLADLLDKGAARGVALRILF